MAKPKWTEHWSPNNDQQAALVRLMKEMYLEGTLPMSGMFGAVGELTAAAEERGISYTRCTYSEALSWFWAYEANKIDRYHLRKAKANALTAAASAMAASVASPKLLLEVLKHELGKPEDTTEADGAELQGRIRTLREARKPL